MEAFIDRFRRACGSPQLAWLIIANVALFLIVWIVILSGKSIGATDNFTISWLCVPSEPVFFIHRPWTAVTYMMTHYDFFHLLFNMLWLFWFGSLLHPMVSGRKLLTLFVGGGLTGAALYIAVTALWTASPQGASYLCGASAAVLAVMTAAAIISPERKVSLFLIGQVRLKWIAAVCIALTLLGIGGGNPGAQSAHIGGVLFGGVWPYVAAGKRMRKKSGDFPRHRQPRKNVKRDGTAVATAVAGRLSGTGRLDQLLDKIRLSGYASLTSGERNELNELSQRIDKIREN